MSLLVVGSVALDSVKTPMGIAEEALGGSATYFSLAAKQFAPEVNIVAVVGEDFPKKYLDMLTSKGINLDGLTVKEGQTFRWVGEYDETYSDPETHDTQLNVFQEFDPMLPDTYCKSSFVFLGNIDPTLQQKVVEQCHKPLLVAADTMNFWIEGKLDHLKKLLKNINVLLINALEVRLLSGKRGLLEGGKAILDMGPEVLVIKRGEHGALMLSEDGVFTSPAYPTEKVIDPTGAGDSFAGGFMGYLASRGAVDFEEYKRAVIAGTIIASFNVEGFSVEKLANIDKKEILGRMKRFREITSFTVPQL